MRLQGKKIACFLALPHHTRFFIPLREEIKKEGGELIFIIPLSEYPYELDLVEKNLEYRYFTDYRSPEVGKRIQQGTLDLMRDWAKTCFQWDGFFRWPLFKQSWFFEAVIEEYYCMENFIQVERPDMFIAHHECNRWGQIIGNLCRKTGVPFVTFQEGDYYNDYIGFLIHTQYSCVDLLWGEKTRQVLEDYQCSRDKMFLIGNTHIDSAIRTHSQAENIARTKEELGIPVDKKVVLFLIDIKHAGITREERWKELLNGLEHLEEEAVLVFKWHPSALRDTFDKVQEIFKKLCPKAILLYHYDSYRLLGLTDYCVTLGKTTLAIEGLMFGKPLFTFPTPDTFEDFYVKIGIAQSVYPPGNWFALFETIKNGVPEHIQSNVRQHLEHYFYKLDGQAVHRAIDVMSYVLDVREEVQENGNGSSLKHHSIGCRIPGRISFIIPSGTDSEILLFSLNALSRNVRDSDWEVIVVVHDLEIRQVLDAVSGDLQIVESDHQRLGSLYNEGARRANGEVLVFLTPGVLFPEVDGLIEKVGDGPLGFPLRNQDGSPYCLGIGYDFNATPYKMTDDSKELEGVGGGMIVMRGDLYEQLGGFDEGVANHLVEPDFCLKAKQAGRGIKILQELSAIKVQEAYFGEDLSNENWKNRVRFFAKWVGKIPKDEDVSSFAKEVLKV